jgi:hypothetical protein
VALAVVDRGELGGERQLVGQRRPVEELSLVTSIVSPTVTRKGRRGGEEPAGCAIVTPPRTTAG